MVKRCMFCGKELEYYRKFNTTYQYSGIPRNSILRTIRKCGCKDNKNYRRAFAIYVLSFLVIVVLLTLLIVWSVLFPWGQIYIKRFEMISFFIVVSITCLIVAVFIYAAKKKSVEIKNLVLSCVFCRDSFEKVQPDEIINCSKCGSKIPICPMCKDNVYHEDQVYQSKPCEHLFHKICLYEWLAENQKCPICDEEIKEVDMDMSDLFDSSSKSKN